MGKLEGRWVGGEISDERLELASAMSLSSAVSLPFQQALLMKLDVMEIDS